MAFPLRTDNVQVQMVPTETPSAILEDKGTNDQPVETQTRLDDQGGTTINVRRKQIINNSEMTMTVKKNCIACLRVDTVVLLTYTGILCGLSFNLYSMYNPRFILFGREGAEVFLFWGICFGGLILKFAREYIIFFCNNRHRKRKSTISTKNSTSALPNDCLLYIGKLIRFQTYFEINGKYFLFKMYSMEIAERANQVYNMLTLYVCQLDTTALYILIAVMMFEIAYSTRDVFKMNSSAQRDRQILVDMFVDTFCLAFPLSFIYFAHDVPIDLWEMVRLTCVPMYGLMTKITALMENVLTLAQQKQKLIKTSSRGRLSVATMSIQIGCMTKGRKIFLTIVNSMFFLFYASLVVSQTVVHSGHIDTQKCTDLYEIDTIWESCRLEVPFCQNPYVPRCDCAVLTIPYYQNRTLPTSFEIMKSLIKLQIYSGNLESLPSNMPDNHKRLVILFITRNRLMYLPDNIGDVKRLLRITLTSNRLKAIPKSIGRLRDLVDLDAKHNNITTLPDSIGNAKLLRALYLGHNKLSRLPSTISKLHNLEELFLRNNYLESLPDDIGNLQFLEELVLSNNRLKVLPESIKELMHLEFFDAWNNQLSQFPAIDTQDWIHMKYIDIRHNPSLRSLPNAFVQNGGLTNLKEISMFNTSACSNDALLSDLRDANVLYSCEKQCTRDCAAYERGNGECDDTEYVYDWASFDGSMPEILPVEGEGCNTARCDYDDGDCPML